MAPCVLGIAFRALGYHAAVALVFRSDLFGHRGTPGLSLAFHVP